MIGVLLLLVMVIGIFAWWPTVEAAYSDPSGPHHADALFLLEDGTVLCDYCYDEVRLADPYDTDRGRYLRLRMIQGQCSDCDAVLTAAEQSGTMLV